MTPVAANLAEIRERILEAARRAGRKPEEITLLGVTKTVPAERIEEAVQAGLRDIGENRVQEASAKFTAAFRDVRKHLIGHLQSNKARRAIELFDVIQSVDSLELALRLDRIAGEMGKSIDAFVEVNLGNEFSKSGIAAADLPRLLNDISKLPNLRLKGLMAIPPFSEDALRSRPYFSALRELRDRYNRDCSASGVVAELSMGMSHDFEIGIEEGATIVRIGTAIFGERSALAAKPANLEKEEQ